MSTAKEELTRLIQEQPDDRSPDEDDESENERDEQLFGATHQRISGRRLGATCRAGAPSRRPQAIIRAREPWAP